MILLLDSRKQNDSDDDESPEDTIQISKKKKGKETPEVEMKKEELKESVISVKENANRMSDLSHLVQLQEQKTQPLSTAYDD